MTRFLAFFPWLVPFAAPARAHEGHDHEFCPPGAWCDWAALVGSWGLIALGILFWLVALLRMYQARKEKETAGWCRPRWPVLGLTFIALGVAALVGWR